MESIVGPESHEQPEDQFADVAGAAEDLGMLVVVVLVKVRKMIVKQILLRNGLFTVFDLRKSQIRLFKWSGYSAYGEIMLSSLFLREMLR